MDCAADSEARLAELHEALARAVRCWREGRSNEAEAACRRILLTDPDRPEAHHLLGLVVGLSGRSDEGIAHLRRAIELAPQEAILQADLGEMHRRAGQLDLAIEVGRRAAELDSTNAVIWNNLGNALYEAKAYEEAAEVYRSAIAARPDFARVYFSLGNSLYELKRFGAAIEPYRRAVTLDPLNAAAFRRLGTVLHEQALYPDAIAAFRRALALAPDFADAHWALGFLLLMQGDFIEGWAEHEWRLRSASADAPLAPKAPWRGENLAGKHIYVRAEQGLGDTIQFARYLPWLARRAGKVSFHVDDRLFALMRESLPSVEVPDGAGIPTPHDCDVSLMSLPHHFKMRLETLPADTPYLRAPQEAIARWREKLASMRGLKVGLVWASGRRHPEAHQSRSLDPALLAPLLEIPGTSFASLQFGPDAVDLTRLNGKAERVLDLSRELGDFADTAGAMMALDLVISIDSSPAHLAGALGKPVFVLIPEIADWRWLLDRDDTPWYPTMRLFRQKKGEDWTPAIARMAEALRQAIENPSLLTPFKTAGERRAAAAHAVLEQETLQARNETSPLPSMAAADMLHLADQKFQNGLLAEAEDLCQRALLQENVKGPAPYDAQAIHLLGLIAHQSGKSVEAVGRICRAIALKPNDAVYHSNLGELCRLAGRTEEAIASCRRAVGLDPNLAAAHNNLGIALLDQGNREEALAHFDRAVALQDNFAQAHINRGDALQRLGRLAEAEFAYRKALALHPNHPQILARLADGAEERA